jgi:hypothetical protein
MEEVISYTVDFSLGGVYAILGVFDENHKVITNRLVNLGRAGFDLLMEANPTWAPNKPANNFRKEDIFTVMQIMGVQ